MHKSSTAALAAASEMGSRSNAPQERAGRFQVLVETLLIFAVFFLHAAWPVPDVNEAHYLVKARHFWSPEWIEHDVFLKSVDAHGVFYRTIGWLALVLPLPALAWVGRIGTWGLLAWSWRRLSVAIVPRPWFAVASAALFVCCSENCQMAGEWVIGGFEAKGIAYTLVFLALEALVRDRWTRAILLLGGASSFHVLVGGWTVVALAFAWLCSGRGRRPTLMALTPALTGGLLLALPGLLFALALDWGVDAESQQQANVIYVYERLRHHLVPQSFAPELVLKHVLLVATWLGLCCVTPYDDGQRRLRLAVLGALAITLCGVAIAMATADAPDRGAGLLRYYWFRLGDALLPLGAALTAIAWVHYARRLSPGLARFGLGMVVAIGGVYLSGQAVRRVLPDVPRGDRPGKVARYDDWRTTCEWIRRNTPPDARFLTPRMAQTFKWRAERAEVACWKDLPQDTMGILDWWACMKLIHWSGPSDTGHWRGSLADLSPEELRWLGVEFQVHYVVTESDPPLALKRVYPVDPAETSAYAVYELLP